MKEKMVLVPVKELKKVIDYSIIDERHHWEEDDCPPNHIYMSFKKLEECL